MAKKIIPKKKTQKKKKEEEEKEVNEEELEEDEDEDESEEDVLPTKGGKTAIKAPAMHDDEDEVEDFWDSKPAPKDSDEDDLWGDDEDDEDDMDGFSEE